jgi:tyrosyl-tRNA synthetase
MSISDALMLRYYELLAGEDVAGLREAIAAERLHPMEVKKRLAHVLVARFHGEDAAVKAARGFARRFQQRELPADVSTVTLRTEAEAVGVVDVLASTGLVSSRSEARRMIAQGAVRIDGERVSGQDAQVATARRRIVVQVGPRRIRAVEFFFEGPCGKP